MQHAPRNANLGPLIALCAVALVGCRAVKHETPIPPLPPLPRTAMPSAGKVSRLAIVLPPPVQRVVVIAWSNQPSAAADRYFSALEASTNLVNWAEVARLPYTAEITVTLTNRPTREFYRAYNGVK